LRVQGRSKGKQRVICTASVIRKITEVRSKDHRKYRTEQFSTKLILRHNVYIIAPMYITLIYSAPEYQKLPWIQSGIDFFPIWETGVSQNMCLRCLWLTSISVLKHLHCYENNERLSTSVPNTEILVFKFLHMYVYFLSRVGFFFLWDTAFSLELLSSWKHCPECGLNRYGCSIWSYGVGCKKLWQNNMQILLLIMLNLILMAFN
jgi:hypothetical protein